jgi:serine/threonine-protein kinase
MPGRTLDHYELLDLLGQGGMGVVYRARDARLNRLVAIKVLSPAAGSDAARAARLVREASAASALTHPAIVTIYDIGCCNDAHYIAMELVAGRPLSEAIPRTGLPVDEALRIARQLAGALQCAHAAGIVHRDLKPANIMIGAGDMVKVLDFGLAKRDDPSGRSSMAGTLSNLTDPGTVLGTAAYMAPEQAQGLSVDARADIFSFGAVLYEMLSGRSPFQRESVASTLAAVLRDEPPRLESLSKSVARVLDRCLNKARERRYVDGEQLAADLGTVTAIHGGKPVPFVAVLPFANLCPDPDNEYFCDGLSEEILNLLARTPGLRVIARTSAFAWKGKAEDIRTIGATLGVDSLLEGSVRRAGERLRVTVQLVDASNGRPLWSSRYDRHLTDVFAVQEEIATEVVTALHGTLFAPPPAPAPAGGDAHEAYLRGRHFWNRFTNDSMEKALELFGQASTLDPAYALAHVGRADCYLQLGHVRAGHMRPLEAFPQARRAAETALALDPRLADAHCALACCLYWHDWDWSGAEQAFRHAIHLNPNHVISRQWYALFLATMRRFDAAEDEIQRALHVDPLSPLLLTYSMAVAYFAGRFDRALQRFARVVEIAPDYPWALHWLSLVHGDQGDYARAIDILRGLLEMEPRMTAAVCRLGLYGGLAGLPEVSHQALARLDELSSEQYVDPLIRAWPWIGLGELGRAIALHKEGVEQRSPLFTIVPVDPSCRLLFDVPEYADVLRRLRYPIDDLALRTGLTESP